MSNEERLKKLDLPTLTFRRIQGDTIETYKILGGIYYQTACKYLFVMQDDTGIRGLNKKI